MSDGPPDPDALARTAAQFIADRMGIAEHDVAIVLGSGWAPAVSALGQPTAILPMAELPWFTPPSAAGHTGQVLSVPIGEHRVLVLAGRVHAYEGHHLQHVVHPVRTACAAGARVVVLTNAAGAVREDFAVGWPRADTAGAQPDPSTIATSCSAIPMRSAMDCAAVRASASGSGGPSLTVGSLIAAPSAELLQRTQEDVSVVGGKLSEPVLLTALDGYLHGVLDGTA